MDKSWILAKTAAGVEEIATRARRVHPRVRAVLILVDGRRSVQDLMDATSTLGDAREALSFLREQGLVDVAVKAHAVRPVEVASRASVPPAERTPVPLSNGRPPVQRRQSLALARLYLLNAMEQSLRKDDLPVRECLRNATTRAELLHAFELCREIATEVGVRHIGRIEEQFLGMLPEEG